MSLLQLCSSTSSHGVGRGTENNCWKQQSIFSSAFPQLRLSGGSMFSPVLPCPPRSMKLMGKLKKPTLSLSFNFLFPAWLLYGLVLFWLTKEIPGHPACGMLAGTLLGITGRLRPGAGDCTAQAVLQLEHWINWWQRHVWFHPEKLQERSVRFHLSLTIFHNPWATLFIFTILDWKMA